MRPAPIILSIAVAIGSASDASAKTDLLRTLSGHAVHWADREITIGLDASAPSQTVSPEGVREALQAAVEAWNEVPELPLRFSVVAVPNPSVRVRFCRGGWKGDLDDLGKAVFTADSATGVVSLAVVEINECDRSFLPPDQAQDGRFDLQAVLTHELGHLLGLAHSDDPSALMFSRGGTAGIRTPRADDRAGIALIYGTDMTVATGVGSSPALGTWAGLPITPSGLQPSPSPAANHHARPSARARAQQAGVVEGVQVTMSPQGETSGEEGQVGSRREWDPFQDSHVRSTPPPPVPIERADTAPPPSLRLVPIEWAARSGAPQPPPDVATAMRVAGNDGTAMIVYTCEPTLLPPVSLVNPAADHRRRTHRTPRGHVQGPPVTTGP